MSFLQNNENFWAHNKLETLYDNKIINSLDEFLLPAEYTLLW
jgi:hypothetical protein